MKLTKQISFIAKPQIALFWHYYDKISSILPPYFFALSLQLKCRLSGSKTRVSVFDSPLNIPTYCYRENNITRLFAARTQALRCYGFGLSRRINQLVQAYNLDQIQFNDSDLIIDCGANTGDLQLCFASLGVKPRYIGIEPSPAEYYCLGANLLFDQSSAHNLAFFNEASNVEFYLSSECADSSLFKPSLDSLPILVETITLNEFITRENLHNVPVKLLKLEAEGAEPEILEGASDVLRNIHYISADMGFERGLSQDSTLPSVTNYLLAHGFELVSYSRTRIAGLFKNTRFP